MRLSLALAMATAAGSMFGAGAPSVPPRQDINLDANWRFEYVGAEARPTDDQAAGWTPAEAAPAADDSSWQPATLPHTWNALDGEDGGNNYRRGAGWYRRHLRLDERLGGKRLYLQFDGACFMTDVFVNGRYLGTHMGGFARFRFDATDALKPGQDNVVAVRVDNGKLGIPPTAADFTFFGGLYRDVSLLVTDPVQITAMDYGSPGVFVTQKSVTPESADLEVRTTVENHLAEPASAVASIEITDAGGNVVLSDRVPIAPIPAGGARDVVADATLAHPHLWNARADPYLYKVAVTVERDLGATAPVRTDEVDVPLGVRFFRVDPDQGFFLNGRHLDLHGVNRHQDRIDKGWAISDEDEAEDFGLIWELGCTAIRISHYQQSDSWYSRCDRAGIVGWAEMPFVGQPAAEPLFLANAKQQLRELIRQNYNHPSICFWSIGNETHGAAADGVLAQLAPVVRAEDPTRLSTYASDAPGDDPKNWHTDVVGFNRYYGWYRGTVSQIGPDLDGIHAAHPKSGFGVSEYGAGASVFQHADHPAPPAARGPFHPEEYQAQFHEAYWPVLKARPYLWGKFIWCMFDFASDGRNEGDHPGRNDKGLVTYDRKIRKDAFYYYKANWSDEPVLRVTSSRFTDRTDPQTEIKVYSNASEVEVSLNGVPLGSKADPGQTRVFVWPGVTLSSGENRVTATARFGDQVRTDSCVWTLKPKS
jgi:beta-galactosidase